MELYKKNEPYVYYMADVPWYLCHLKGIDFGPL